MSRSENVDDYIIVGFGEKNDLDGDGISSANCRAYTSYLRIASAHSMQKAILFVLHALGNLDI